MSSSIWQRHAACSCWLASRTFRSVKKRSHGEQSGTQCGRHGRAHCSATVQQQEQQQGSLRIRQTDAPVIVTTKQLMQGQQGVLSLAQGRRQQRLPGERTSHPSYTGAAGKLQGLCIGALPQQHSRQPRRLCRTQLSIRMAQQMATHRL